jgi:hypothetical protein
VVKWTSLIFVRFEVLSAVTMKRTIFWDVTLCSPVDVHQRFGGTYCLHLQGQKVSTARSRWWAEGTTCRKLGCDIGSEGYKPIIADVLKTLGVYNVL